MRPVRPPPSKENAKRKALEADTEEQADLRSKIPRLQFQEEEADDSDLLRSFDDVDLDNGLIPDSLGEDVQDEIDILDDEEVEDPAPVDVPLILQHLGEVIENDWTRTVTKRYFPIDTYTHEIPAKSKYRFDPAQLYTDHRTKCFCFYPHPPYKKNTTIDYNIYVYNF